MNQNYLFNVFYFFKSFNFLLVNLFWLFFENATLETITYLSFVIFLFLLFGTEAGMLMSIRIFCVFGFVGYPLNFMHFNVFGTELCCVAQKEKNPYCGWNSASL